MLPDQDRLASRPVEREAAPPADPLYWPGRILCKLQLSTAFSESPGMSRVSRQSSVKLVLAEMKRAVSATASMAGILIDDLIGHGVVSCRC